MNEPDTLPTTERTEPERASPPHTTPLVIKVMMAIVLPYLASLGFAYLAHACPRWNLLGTPPLVVFSLWMAYLGARRLAPLIPIRPGQPKRQKPFLVGVYFLFIASTLPIVVLWLMCVVFGDCA